MWKFASNTFDSATRKTFRKMLMLVTDHLARLLSLMVGDVVVEAIYNRTLPIKNDYDTAYMGMLSQKALYEGETQRVEDFLEELTAEKAARWSALVVAKFPKGTPDYKVLLPQDSKPFQNGPYDVRISYIGSLANNLAAYPQLNSLRNEVQDFYNDIFTTRTNQQKIESDARESSIELEKKRKEVARIMFGNAGLLMDRHSDNPVEVEKYFDLHLIRSKTIKDDEPADKTVVLVSRQTILQTIELGLAGLAGFSVLVEWGDGTSQVYTFTEAGAIFFNHDYVTPGTYHIKITGNTEAIKEIHSNNSKLVTINMTTMPNLTEVIMQTNDIDQPSMNNMVIVLAANGIENGVLNALAGTSAAPDLTIPEVAEAMNLLQSRGWTILTN